MREGKECYYDTYTSDEGLEICLDFDWDALEILKANRDAIKQELKNRRVKSVGYVENNISGVVTIQAADSAMEMSAWQDIRCEKLIALVEGYGGHQVFYVCFAAFLLKVRRDLFCIL